MVVAKITGFPEAGPTKLKCYDLAPRLHLETRSVVCLASEKGYSSKVSLLPRSVFVCGLFCGLVTAAPQLRLSSATIGPVFIAVGQNGAAQSVTTSNIGEGSLSLAATANASWLAPSVGTGAINIALNTAALSRGSYTGLVTVSDPNAVDAPQTITVTVQVGSAVPDSLDLYLAPGGSASAAFTTSSLLGVSINNPTGGPTLAVSTSGGGSFAFSLPYQVIASAPAGTPANDYAASFTVSGSSFAADNKTVPVTEHVTTQPITAWSPASVQFGIAQGAATQTQGIGFSNPGQGTLTLSGVTGNPSWLSTSVQGNAVYLTADATGMTPGTYQATLTIASNAVNGPSLVPVELNVLITGPALTNFQGVVDNALFAQGQALAPGGIAALYGEQLTTGPAVSAASVPLGATLGGAAVFVNNQPAPLYYVSAGQINFQIPYGAQGGPAVVRVDRDGLTGNIVSFNIVPAAPRLLSFYLGSQNYAIALFPDNVTYAIPSTPGIPSRPAVAGVDTLVFYALGLGQTNPPATEGQAAPFAQVAQSTMVFGESILPGTGATAVPAYAGLSPGSVGLYQINVLVPAQSPKGNAVPVYFDMGGDVLSNSVNIAIQ
jgi:uncharacterized protein (TIGR03437 family)